MTVTVTRDWVDYLLSIIPIVLSAVAIWISIHLSRQQNNIALFEKRYGSYKLLQFIGVFCSKISQDTLNTIEDCKSCANDKLIEEYEATICSMLSLWANRRILFEGTMSDEARLKCMYTCMGGTTDFKLADLLDSYLQSDKEELDKTSLLFDQKTAEIIDETAEAYFELCSQMILCIHQQRAHAIEGYDKKLRRFIDAAQNWEIGSPAMKKIKRIIRL